MLQNRHWKQKIKDWYRGRWATASMEKKHTKRQKERESIEKGRVESVEIYKPGHNDKSFKSIIQDKERNQGYVEFHDLEIEDESCYFAENVLVHNCHHLSGPSTQYFKFMINNNSPVRIGFTATFPKKDESSMAIEGCLGPIIGEYKSEEGIKEGFTAKPFITLIPVAMTTQIAGLKKYKDIYRYGVVENRVRNRLILTKASARIKNGKTVLILVKEINHGNILQEMGEAIFGVDCVFVRGSTEGQIREEVRILLDQKKVKLVICTAVWKEGVDIPSLNCVIDAASGKSEIGTLQVIGRGSRKTKDKDEVEIIDFLDPYKYLAQHAIIRLGIYVKQNWL